MLEYIFPEIVFSHGQLYVALSKEISMKTTKVWIKIIGDNKLPSNCTKKYFLIYASLTFKFLYFNLIVVTFVCVHLILLNFKFSTFKFSTT